MLLNWGLFTEYLNIWGFLIFSNDLIENYVLIHHTRCTYSETGQICRNYMNSGERTSVPNFTSLVPVFRHPWRELPDVPWWHHVVRTRGLSVRAVWLRVPAPVRGHQRKVQKGEAPPDDLVSRHGQDQEEDALLLKLRCPQEVPRRIHNLHSGTADS